MKKKSDEVWIKELLASPHARAYDWRATAEAVADDLCNRLALAKYVDYAIDAGRMTLTLEDAGNREAVVTPFTQDSRDEVVAAICALAMPEVHRYRVRLLDRSDTYAYLLLPEEEERRMRAHKSVDWTRPLTDEIDDFHATVRVRYGMGRIAEEAASHQTTEFFTRLLEVSGAKESDVRLTSKSWAGDVVTKIAMTWKR